MARERQTVASRIAGIVIIEDHSNPELAKDVWGIFLRQHQAQSQRVSSSDRNVQFITKPLYGCDGASRQGVETCKGQAINFVFIPGP